MSPHRIISRKQNKLIVIAAAGTLMVATAASAAAVALPSGAPAASGAPSGAAFSAVTARSGRTVADRGTQQSHLAAQRFRVVADHQAMATMLVHMQAVVHPPAFAQAAKDQTQAELTAKQEAAHEPAQQGSGQQTVSQETASQQAASSTAASQQAGGLAAVSSASTASRSPQSIAQAMLGSFGWPASQFSCLEPLWAAESGWSVTASNPSTGAYGIPQAMPGSKMASAGPNWQTSAETQIRWGLGYIKSRYGSPCVAWNHEEAYGWY
ncbi:MAG: lytic transglycosylase domain-containing protein [Streptosporangiaceae bacterium]